MSELEVGLVLKPQGIRGELKVLPYTDSAEDFRAFKRVFLDGEEYRVLSVRTGSGAVYLGLRGVPDRNAAESLRGKKVAVPRDEAPEPPEGRYYIADLLGALVVDEEGREIGRLKEITKAATDIYVLEEGEKEILFPAAEGVVLSVQPEARRIVVNGKRFGEVAVR